MRFPAATAPKQPLRETVITHPGFIRRLAAGQPAPEDRPAPACEQIQDDLPAALDERVRLVGEW